MKKKAAGTLYGITASVSYGTNPLFAIPLYGIGIGVNSVLFYRYFFAVIIYFIWLKLFKKISLKINKKETISLFIAGILFSLSSLTLFEAFKHIDAGIACTILFIYPIIVALIMSIFFKEKIKRETVLAILLTFIGIMLLYKGKIDTSLNIYGIGVVLISAIVYALYIVMVKVNNNLRHIKSEKLSFYVMLFGLSIYIINLKFCTQLQFSTNHLFWICSFGLAIFPTIISIETINYAIKLIGSTYTAILGALEPLTAVCIGVLIFNEQLTIRIVSGIILIISGVLFIILKRAK